MKLENRQTALHRRRLLSPTIWLAAATTLGEAVAQSTASKDPREKNLALGEAEAKRMLLLMDKDQNGKVSKQEFLSFMEAEFDRLDKNTDGGLDVKELTQSQVRLRGAISR